MSFSTEIVNLAVLSQSVTTPSQRDFVFDFDLSGYNVVLINTLIPQFVKYGNSTAVTRNAHNTQSDRVLLDNTNTINFNTLIDTSASTSAYIATTNIIHQFYIDTVYNKILLTLAIQGSPFFPSVPIWCNYTFRGANV